MQKIYPNCPECNSKGQIVELNIRRCLNNECSQDIFIRNGPYAYAIRCFHNDMCQKDEAGNSRMCVSHCDLSWNAYTFNQAELIRMMHEAEHDTHTVQVREI